MRKKINSVIALLLHGSKYNFVAIFPKKSTIKKQLTPNPRTFDLSEINIH